MASPNHNLTLKFGLVILLLILSTPMVSVYSLYRGAQVTQTVKIGDIVANTDELPRTQALSNIAIEDINKYMEDNNLPWRFEAVIKNAEGSAATHLAKIQELKAEGVNMVIGGRWGSFVTQCIQYINSNGVLLICPNLTTQMFNQDDNFFRTCPTEPKQAAPLSYFVVTQYHITMSSRVVVLQRDDAFGNSLFEALNSQFIARTQMGVTQVKYNTATTNFSSVLQTVAGYQPLAIIVLGYDEVATILNQAKDNVALNNVPWFGTQTNVGQQAILGDAADAAKKLHLLSPSPSIFPSDLYDKVKTRYLSQSGSDMSFYAASEYDAYWLYALSVAAAGASDAASVKPKLLSTSTSFIGVSGLCAMDKNGDRLGADYNFFAYDDEGGATISRYNGYYSNNTNSLQWIGSTATKTKLTASFSSNPATVGSTVSISGAITPAITARAIIAVRVRGYDGTTSQVYIYANDDGTWSGFLFKPQKTGIYIAQAFWHNDVRTSPFQRFNYTQAVSNYLLLTVEQIAQKTDTSISIAASSNIVNINDQIKVTANLTPQVTGAKLTFTITKPDTTVQTVEVSADNTGAYIYQFSPSAIGSWSVKASWSGDATHNGSTSSTTQIVVNQPPPPKTNLRVIVKDTSSVAVAGAAVTSTSQPSGQSALSGTTGADGAVTFSDIQPGSYSLTVSKTDYTTKTDTAAVAQGTTTDKTVTLEKPAPSGGGGIPNAPLEAIALGVLIGILLYSWKKH